MCAYTYTKISKSFISKFSKAMRPIGDRVYAFSNNPFDFFQNVKQIKVKIYDNIVERIMSLRVTKEIQLFFA